MLFLPGCDPEGSDPLTVGMELNYPPFEMIDAAGQAAGISVELAQALGEYLQRPVKIENIPFDGLIPALKTRKIDLIISSMTETPARAQSIDFSDPYLRTGLCMLVSKKSSVRTIADADQPGHYIAVKQGTTGQLFAQERFKHARTLVLPKEDACVLEVVQGKAQAFLYDQMSVFKHWQKNPDTTVAVLQAFQRESWAIGLRKGNDQARAKVNEFLKSFRAAGGFDRLAEKYLNAEKEAFEARGIPFYF